MNNHLVAANRQFQLVWTLYQYNLWTKDELMDWVYQQLADEPDNLFWTNLIMYEPNVYFCLYTEQFPPLRPLSFKQAFALHLAQVDINSIDSIDAFNRWLISIFYGSDYDEMPDDPDTPECYYFYHLEHQLEYQSQEETLPWIRQQLQLLIPEAQQQAQQLLSILK